MHERTAHRDASLGPTTDTARRVALRVSRTSDQASIAAAKLEESESNARIKELERQLNILKQVTQHASSLAPIESANAR